MRLAGLIAAAAALALPAPAAAQQVPVELRPGEVLLQVEAEGIHAVRPDLMTVTAGVVTTAATAREALAANSALAARMIEAVRGRGVEARDVRTSRLEVDPRMSRKEAREAEDLPPRILGYVARNEVQLHLRDLAAAPEIIDALFEAGANRVQGPMFGLTDPDAAQRAVRKAAIAEAAKEAQGYADALDMRVARVLRVSERGRFEVSDGSIVVTGNRVHPTPIEPGEIEVETKVWIDYALVPR